MASCTIPLILRHCKGRRSLVLLYVCCNLLFAMAHGRGPNGRPSAVFMNSLPITEPWHAWEKVSWCFILPSRNRGRVGICSTSSRHTFPLGNSCHCLGSSSECSLLLLMTINQIYQECTSSLVFIVISTRTVQSPHNLGLEYARRITIDIPTEYY